MPLLGRDLKVCDILTDGYDTFIILDIKSEGRYIKIAIYSFVHKKSSQWFSEPYCEIALNLL